AWVKAKAAEAEANATRVAIEAEIIAITGAKDEGRETHTLPNHKITVIGKLTYKAEFEPLHELTEQWPEQFQVIKYEPKLDEPKIRKIREMRPDLYRQIAQHLTVKPAKTGITVDVL
ncbi:MAG: hypothetical protein ACK5X3_21450, partial [Pseudomonadota bacterium]